MGRRPRRRSPPAEKHDNRDEDNLQKEEGLQSIIQLLKDLYAIRHHQSQRQTQNDESSSLVMAMKEMANILDSINFAINNHSNDKKQGNDNYYNKPQHYHLEKLKEEHQNNNNDCTKLVTLEQHSFHLRSAANHHISVTLPTLQSKALSLYTQLSPSKANASSQYLNLGGSCTTIKTSAAAALSIIGKAIYTELQKQFYLEESIATKIIFYLDVLYNGSCMDQGKENGGTFQHTFSRWLRLHSGLLQKNSFVTSSSSSTFDVIWPTILENLECFSEEEVKQQQKIDLNNVKQPTVPDKNEVIEEQTTSLPSLSSSNPIEKTKSTSHSLRRRMQSTSNIWEVMTIFLSHPHNVNESPSSVKDTGTQDSKVISVLLVGPSGCGKTHLCDSIQQYLSFSSHSQQTAKVIRPKLPTDLMQDTVGATEDLIISMFTYAKNVVRQGSRNCVILLDGMEHILSYSFNNGDKSGASGGSNNNSAAAEESHLMLRIRSTFLAVLDSFQRDYNNSNQRGGSVLLIGTARNIGNSLSNRFDKIIHMESSPSPLTREVEYSKMISACLQPEAQQKDNEESVSNQNDKVQELLSNIVKCAAGKSAADISRSCRDALIALESPQDLPLTFKHNDEASTLSSSTTLYEQRLQHLKSSLQTIVPTSIKSGGSLDDGILDVTIYTSKELCSTLQYSEDTKRPVLPLFGSNASSAWKQIETLIITPLCQSNELEDILYGGDNDDMFGDNTAQQQRGGGGGGGGGGGKIVCAGTLLTGPPGSGKSVLAKHCASVAASMVPSIRLLDVSCTSLIHKEVGGSERAVQKLFAAARAASPCIILLDGIEHIAPLRGHDNTTEGTMDRLLSTVLTEMDGIDERSTSGDDGGDDKAARGKVAVIGITHNPKWIDPALRRPGRLEKCIVLDRPDVKTRKDIVRHEIEKLPIDLSASSFFEPKDKDALAEYVALQTHGMSASEVIAVCTEACMTCIRDIVFHGDDSHDVESEIKTPILSHRHFVDALHFRKSGTSKSGTK